MVHAYRPISRRRSIASSKRRSITPPNTLLPSGSVRVGTDFSDGRTGLSSLTFGGGDGDYYEQTSNGELQNELSWLPSNGKHKVKIGGQVSYNRSNYFYFPGSPLLGS